MRVIFFGTPQFAVPTLECLIQHPEFEVCGVVTQPDKPRGRGSRVSPSPVKAVAASDKIPVWQPRRIKKSPEILAQLRQAQADAFVVVAYGQILSPEILAIPRLGCINGHGSLLPRYRGAAPIQWCLYHGEAETGMTTILMDAGMDTGAMLLQNSCPIGLLENARELASKLSVSCSQLLIETLFKLDQGQLQPIPQQESEATYAPLIQPTDYGLDWSNSALALHNQIRGFFPHCTTRFRGEDLKVSGTVPLDMEYWSQLPEDLQALAKSWPSLVEQTSQPGTVIKIIKKLGPVIQTGSGLLLLRDVQRIGKRSQSGWDFANGTRLSVGELLG
ncbi:MAG: methionyl-tRNA formyltransferase [Oscillatoriales cyanobacterium RM1_1_9]|nr:methionyl-tRNA formyltransferase [Oscillatoriales cyanobacterium RM2_1_1]NJO71386.1 methionyl-tRNA formyltransferase [Oscillatoriales cyanobacterium RM1_1_9]